MPQIIAKFLHSINVIVFVLTAVILFFTVATSNSRKTAIFPDSEFFFSTTDSVFQVGEELTYNVSYASFDIGQVRITLVAKTTRDGKVYYKALTHIDSYKGVPFVNLHAIYEDSIHQQIYSTWFRSRHKNNDAWDYFTYTYSYPKHKMNIEQGKWPSMNVTKRDSLLLDTVYQDGLSLFYFARANILTKQKLNIPTLVNEKKGTTFIDFQANRAHEEIDAVDYPIDLVHFEGEAGFVGIFGLTGAFEGWFSNDAARVPVIAKMKVLIGNIRIELMKWKRTNWAPPRYVEEKK